MSVIENVMVGCHVWTKADFLSTGLKLPRAKVEERSILEAAMSKLSSVGLEQKAFVTPCSLSWGQQKLLGLARALATDPELLLLDEPYGGLIADEIEKLNQLILELQRQGITILMVEQLTDVVMGIANQVIVLNYGDKIAQGTPSEIQGNEQVIVTYLGREPGENERR
jgi:ABC-type branched-subunit amino acid transport system ATPase component